MKSRLLAVFLGAFASAATAGTFNLFSPANGILVGNPSTYVTTAATSSNVRALWTGTCDATTYLRGDGQCQAPPGGGGGTVNSVALTAPPVYSVTGSPVTTTGTLALSFATGQTANSFLATPDGSTGALSLRTIVADDLPAIDLTSGVTGTLPVANGGTGAASLTDHGVLVGSGTGAVTPLAVLTDDQILRGSTGADPVATSLVNCGSSTQALAYNTTTHAFSCQTISAGTGTVTSVAATVPSVLSVSGSPVTTSGTLAIDWATGQTQNRVLASPNGSSGQVALRALVGADVPAINLGTSGNGGVTGNLPVANLNSGTSASGTTFWAGDGTWKTPGGSVTPAALTRTDDTNVTLTLGGTPSTALLQATSITAGWSGQLSVPRGGTGLATLTGLALGNGTSAMSAYTGTSCTNQFPRSLNASGVATCANVALASDVSGNLPVTNLNSGTSATSSTFWRGDGTWSTPVDTGCVGANPTGTIGLTAVNGAASTCIRSDGAPALSQAISPTWTAQHVFSKNGTTAINSAIVLQTSVNPFLAWNQTGAAANSRAWDMGADSGTLLLRTADDAATAARNILAVSRSGVAVSNIALGNATDNNTFSFLGTGAVTSNGSTIPTVASSPTWTGNHTFTPASGNTAVLAGNMGVGTSTFTSDVSGTNTMLAVKGLATNAIGTVQVHSKGTTNLSKIELYASDGTADVGLYSKSNSSMSFATNDTVRMVIAAGGSVTSTGVHLGPNGSASAPTYSNSGDTNTGFNLPGSDVATISTGGTNRVTVGPGVQVGAPTGGDQGAGTINATALYVNGASVTVGAQKSAYAYIDASGGGCAIGSSPFTSVNVLSCSRGATGNIAVTVSGFSTRPVCTGNVTAGVGVGTGAYLISFASSTSNVAVTLYDTTGAPAFNSFNLTCFGT